MKKLICILLTIVSISFAGGAMAQQARKTPPTPEQRAERRAGYLKKELSLSDAQYNQVKDAALKIENERKSNNDKKNIGKEFEAQLKGILNPEQFEKYAAMREERKEKVKARMEEKRVEEKTKSEGAVEDKKD